MLEAKVQANILRYLKTQPCYVIKNVLSNTKGHPDIFICYRGFFIFIEVKSPSKPAQLTPVQNVRVNQLRSHGARGMVVNCFSDFIANFSAIKKEIDEQLELIQAFTIH